jgi:hypothetical protein
MSTKSHTLSLVVRKYVRQRAACSLWTRWPISVRTTPIPSSVKIGIATGRLKDGKVSPLATAMAIARTRYQLMMREVEASKAIAWKAANMALKKARR